MCKFISCLRCFMFTRVRCVMFDLVKCSLLTIRLDSFNVAQTWSCYDLVCLMLEDSELRLTL